MKSRNKKGSGLIITLIIVASLIAVLVLTCIGIAIYGMLSDDGKKSDDDGESRKADSSVEVSDDISPEVSGEQGDPILITVEYVGEEFEIISRALERLGIKVNKIEIEITGNDYQDGEIISCDKSVGEKLFDGDEITFEVAVVVTPELPEDRAWELVCAYHDSDYMQFLFADRVDYSDTLMVNVVPEEMGFTQYEEFPSVVGIDTVEDFKYALSEWFTDEFIDNNFIYVQSPDYIEENGTLYFETCWGIGFYDMWRDTMEIIDRGNGEFEIRCAGGEPEENKDYYYGYTCHFVKLVDGEYKIYKIDYVG